MQLHDFGRSCTLVVCVDFLPEIRHTAVADFNCRPIKDIVEDVV